MRNFSTLTILCLSFCLNLSAQGQEYKKPVIKFGDIKAEDFAPKAYAVDSSASAVVLADVGSSKFEGNNQGFFSIIFRHFKRIRIMNKNGFDAASYSIEIYRKGDNEEQLDELEAVTYNLENGKVITTRLDKASIFKDKTTKNYTTKKFTLPNVKEGSIIEFRYKITSTLLFARAWEFQGAMPRIWTEYEFSIPQMFDYVTLSQGARTYDIDVIKKKYTTIGVRDNEELLSWSGDMYDHTWGMANVPSLKNEAYTTTVNNYCQKIEFQLHKILWPGGKVEDVLNTWYIFADKLLKNEDFGASLSKSNDFIKETMDQQLKGVNTPSEKAKLIYEYVRNNFVCTDHEGIYLNKSIKKVFQEKSGSEADINLLLTAIYKAYSFQADPVLLSTRSNGKAYELYPLISKFNNVICQLKVDDQNYLLDASNNTLGFGRLSQETYNGYGRVISANPVLVALLPDSLIEKKVTSVFINNDDKTNVISGSLQSDLGYYESLELRQKVNKTSLAEYFKKIKSSFPNDIKIEHPNIDSLKRLDDPITLTYDFSFIPEGDVVYFNPMLNEQMKDNPFKSANREYPVEMPYKIDEMYVLNMDVPKGYKIEELPKSAKVTLNGSEGSFEYIIVSEGDKIQLRCRLVINAVSFPNEDYSVIRDFYSYIVKKQSEAIVFKKQS